MNLGVSYNVFDGAELLPFSIKSIRNQVDHVNVVYQKVSNFGEPIDKESLDILHQLQREKLITSLTPYNTDLSKNAQFNEIAKRNIGLLVNKKFGMTHFMSMDCDEMYFEKDLEHAKSVIEKEGFDASACKMEFYYKYPEIKIKKFFDMYVSLIYKIDHRKFILNEKWDIVVDPTRKMPTTKIKKFDPSEILMHHYSYIRKNIKSKIYNTTTRIAYNDEKLNEMYNYYQDYKPGDKVLIMGINNKVYKEVETVENYFDIKI